MKKYFLISALPALALVSTKAQATQVTPPQHSVTEAPMDGDDGLELSETSIDQDGVPLPKEVVVQRKEIAICLLSRFKSIPETEHEDYAQTVSFYLPHKVTAIENEWIEQRIQIARAETIISRYSSEVESFVLKPSRTSRALEFCLAPKLRT